MCKINSDVTPYDYITVMINMKVMPNKNQTKFK